MKRKQIMSLVRAIQMKNTEKAWKKILVLSEHSSAASYQSLIFEAVVDGSNEQPEGPKVFKPGEHKNIIHSKRSK